MPIFQNITEFRNPNQSPVNTGIIIMTSKTNDKRNKDVII